MRWNGFATVVSKSGKTSSPVGQREPIVVARWAARMLPPETEVMVSTFPSTPSSLRRRTAPRWKRAARYPPPDRRSATPLRSLKGKVDLASVVARRAWRRQFSGKGGRRPARARRGRWWVFVVGLAAQLCAAACICDGRPSRTRDSGPRCCFLRCSCHRRDRGTRIAPRMPLGTLGQRSESPMVCARSQALYGLGSSGTDISSNP